MCNVGDDNFGNDDLSKYMPQEKLSDSAKCNKCRTETPSVVLRSKDKYCKMCFLAGVVHKFKASIGKSKLIRPNDKVLIVHKCGHPSTALLHFIRTGLDLGTHKKLRFDPVILFLDEQLHLSSDARLDLQNQVEKEATDFNFPIYFTSVIRAIENDLEMSQEKVKGSDDDKNSLRDFLAEQGKQSQKNDYIQIVMQEFYVKCAKKLNCKFVFVPEISSDVSAKLLIDLVMGRGSQIPLDSGFCDSRNEPVKILRPLRLCDMKELAFYNYFNRLEPVAVRKARENPNPSVQSLIQKFVGDLQASYPSTVTTVLKIGDKLVIEESGEDAIKCKFCKAICKKRGDDLSSAESTKFSHWISNRTQGTKGLETLKIDTDEESDCCFSCQKLKHKLS